MVKRRAGHELLEKQCWHKYARFLYKANEYTICVSALDVLIGVKIRQSLQAVQKAKS